MAEFDENDIISSGRTDIENGKWDEQDILSSSSKSQADNSSKDDVKNTIRNNIKEVNENKKYSTDKLSGIKPKIKIITDNQQVDLFDEKTGDITGDVFKENKENSNEQQAEMIYSQSEKTKLKGDKIRFNQELKEDSPEDNSNILEEQNHLRNSLIIKFLFCLVFTAFLAFFALVPLTGVPLPPFIDATKQPVIFLAINLVFLLVTGLVVFNVAFTGITSVFRFRADSDSITSLSFYAALLGNLYLLFMFFMNDPSKVAVSASSVFSVCSACAITFNLFGKIFIVSRVKNNFEFLENSGKDSFYSAVSLDESEAKQVYKVFDGEPEVVTTKKIKYVSDYLDSAYSESMSDGISKYLSVVALVIALISAIVIFVIKKDISQAIILFTAVCAISSPLLLEAGTALPFFKTCKRMTKNDTLITGCETVSEFCSTDAIVADSEFLFKNSGIAIHGVKPFSKTKIDESMVYALSIAKAGKSALYYALENMFVDKESARKVIRPVSKICYEDERGLYAVIDNKSVLLGNRRLLRHYMVEAPTRDFEIRSADDKNDVVYLAIDGVLCAMFVVEYKFDENSINAFKRLKHFGVHILIDSTDPNVTPLLLEEKCSMTAKNSLILGAIEMNVLRKRKDGGINNAGLAFKNAGGYIQGIISCIKLQAGMSANSWLQFIFALIGALIVVATALLGGGVSSLNVGYMFIYQILTAVPIILLSLFRKN